MNTEPTGNEAFGPHGEDIDSHPLADGLMAHAALLVAQDENGNPVTMPGVVLDFDDHRSPGTVYRMTLMLDATQPTIVQNLIAKAVAASLANYIASRAEQS